MVKPRLVREVKTGQYWACRFNGKNGDIILGRVQSVRRNGSVILLNMLTKTTSTKSIDVLLARNKRILRKQAWELEGEFEKMKNVRPEHEAMRLTRQKAVEAPEYIAKKRGEAKQLSLPLEPKKVKPKKTQEPVPVTRLVRSMQENLGQAITHLEAVVELLNNAFLVV